MGVKEIAGAVWQGLKAATIWMFGYGQPDAKKAREMNDDREKLDDVRKDLKEENLDELRKKIS